MDKYFRMEIDGWETIPEAPVLLVGVHTGAPFVWDAWMVGAQWWRRFDEARMLHGTAHDALMAFPLIGRRARHSSPDPAAAKIRTRFMPPIMVDSDLALVDDDS